MPDVSVTEYVKQVTTQSTPVTIAYPVEKEVTKTQSYTQQ
jgi:hypothetical protein